jgi:hypothetical protein
MGSYRKLVILHLNKTLLISSSPSLIPRNVDFVSDLVAFNTVGAGVGDHRSIQFDRFGLGCDSPIMMAGSVRAHFMCERPRAFIRRLPRRFVELGRDHGIRAEARGDLNERDWLSL